MIQLQLFRREGKLFLESLQERVTLVPFVHLHNVRTDVNMTMLSLLLFIM